jgi:Ca-activated chloride channel family protein
MEYKNIYLGFLGLFAALFWGIEFWKVFKKPQVIVPPVLKSNNSVLRTGIFFLGIVGWLLISYAMTGPRKALDYTPDKVEVNDIFFVVDVSRSMLADDLQPNRLEVAKEKLREFAKLRPTDRIGIIVFSEKVFTLLPLTTDPTLIDQILSDINVGRLGSGTNIGDALALAVARASDSQTKNKVIILLTDGVNNVGAMAPLKAAAIAKEYGIKVYTIGLGGAEDASIPNGRGFFGKKYLTIPGGSIDMETLQKISEMTNGQTFLASSEGSLKTILDEIQQLEKTEIDVSSRVVYDEKYFPYLLWGLLLFLFTEFLRRFVIKEVL